MALTLRRDAADAAYSRDVRKRFRLRDFLSRSYRLMRLALLPRVTMTRQDERRPTRKSYLGTAARPMRWPAALLGISRRRDDDWSVYA